jgi:hypothetical protein
LNNANNHVDGCIVWVPVEEVMAEVVLKSFLNGRPNYFQMVVELDVLNGLRVGVIIG